MINLCAMAGWNRNPAGFTEKITPNIEIKEAVQSVVLYAGYAAVSVFAAKYVRCSSSWFDCSADALF